VYSCVNLAHETQLRTWCLRKNIAITLQAWNSCTTCNRVLYFDVLPSFLSPSYSNLLLLLYYYSSPLLPLLLLFKYYFVLIITNKNRTRPNPEASAKAKAEKEKGNEEFKKKEYLKAIEHYNNAIDLDPTQFTFYSMFFSPSSPAPSYSLLTLSFPLSYLTLTLSLSL
jgi:hypothetical protein